MESNNTVFNDCKKKRPFIFIFTGLNAGPLAATTHQIARIYFSLKYTKYGEREPPCKVNEGLCRFQHCLAARGRFWACLWNDIWMKKEWSIWYFYAHPDKSAIKKCLKYNSPFPKFWYEVWIENSLAYLKVKNYFKILKTICLLGYFVTSVNLTIFCHVYVPCRMFEPDLLSMFFHKTDIVQWKLRRILDENFVYDRNCEVILAI